MARQTLGYLRTLFEREGIAPRKRYGQNFLIDLNLHDVIVAAGEVGPNDVVLEVGPGAGALTRRMADLGAAVIAVEIDPAMARLTRNAVEGRPNVRVLHRDALANKNRIAPEVLDAVRAGLAVDPVARRFKLVANLPYNVATPILTNLLVAEEPRVELMAVTIQWEVAERIVATPGTSAYGALSVLTNALASAEIVRKLPPSVFWPRPLVDSAIMVIRPDPARRTRLGDVVWFQSVIRRVFNHRRKNIRRVLHGYYRDMLTKSDIEDLLSQAELAPDARAETMTVDQLVGLAHRLKERLHAAPNWDGNSNSSEDSEDALDEKDDDE
jgi:16S rRNA (adenine1518-N6/adenine1519-N6)-dimethyltransferase